MKYYFYFKSTLNETKDCASGYSLYSCFGTTGLTLTADIWLQTDKVKSFKLIIQQLHKETLSVMVIVASNVISGGAFLSLSSTLYWPSSLTRSTPPYCSSLAVKVGTVSLVRVNVKKGVFKSSSQCFSGKHEYKFMSQHLITAALINNSHKCVSFNKERMFSILAIW